MFKELLNTVSKNISTIRSIIHTNDQLRKIVFGESAVTRWELDEDIELTALMWSVPSAADWRVYDHCAVITRLYAIYEGFIEDLVRDWIMCLPNIFPRYSDLAEKIRGTHQIGVANLLLELKKKKHRFEHLSVEKVVRGLFLGVSGSEDKYELVPDAFLLHDQNLWKEALEKLFADAGIPDAWNWVKEHRDVKHFVKEVLANEKTAEGELKELIGYRNEAAHGAVIDNVLGSSTLLEFCNFVEVNKNQADNNNHHCSGVNFQLQ
ncbi:MAG: MAE_28990/MAE_18760 family HEPN-like nuclease [Xenococcaceae cyanobacterium]